MGGFEEPPQIVKDRFADWKNKSIREVLTWLPNHTTMLGSWRHSKSCLDEGWGNYFYVRGLRLNMMEAFVFFITSKESESLWPDDIPHIDIVVYYLHNGNPIYYYTCSGDDFSLNDEYYESIEECLGELMGEDNSGGGVSYTIYVSGLVRPNILKLMKPWPFINWRDNPLIGGGA
ncbi:hypothetical protein CL614_02480 [archaeon]|nr:hypothetical protein [archaeon]